MTRAVKSIVKLTLIHPLAYETFKSAQAQRMSAPLHNIEKISVYGKPATIKFFETNHLI